MNEDVLQEAYGILDEKKEKPRFSKDFLSFIRSRFDTLGLSQRQICNALSISRGSLQHMLSGEAKTIEGGTIKRLARFLDVSGDDLLDLYTESQEEEHEKHKLAGKAGFICRNFDLDALKGVGFLDDKNDFLAIEQRLKRYFDLTSIYEYETDGRLPLFSQTQRDFSRRMLRFWVNAAMHQIRCVGNPHDFDRQTLLKAIPGMRALTRDVETGLLRAAKALSSVGVTVIVQKYLRGTQIRGATFVVNGKPSIILTDFNKRYDTVWFALFHELYHVLKDFERIERIGYHLTGEPEVFMDEMSEQNADDFAGEFLVPPDKRKYVARYIDVPGQMEEYASKWNVHPSILYGQYMWEHGEYNKYRGRIPKPDKALQKLRVYPWEKKTAEEVVEPIRETYEFA